MLPRHAVYRTPSIVWALPPLGAEPVSLGLPRCAQQRSAARHPAPGVPGRTSQQPACGWPGALPAARRGVGEASGGLHNPEGAFPTGLWQNSV